MVFDAYDRDAEAEPADKKGWLEDSIRIREKQIRFYLDLYGEPQKPGPVTGALQQRQRLIQGRFGNALRLRSSEDLAEFLAALFEDTFRAKLRDKQTVTEARRVAWNELLALLRTELGALTTPSGFDLTDDPRQNVDYVSRVYPRALNGGELHDCGVYAVRIAFVLLSVVERLRRLSNITLDVRPSFTAPPLHVGLLVESADVGPVVAHNETIYGLVDALPVFRTAWTAAALPDDPDPSETAALENVVPGGRDGGAFHPGRRHADPAPPGSEAGHAAHREGALDRLPGGRGQGLPEALRPRRRGPGSASDQFDLRYLEVLGLENRWRNEHVVGLWNKTCRKAWERHEKALNTDFKKARGPISPTSSPAYRRLRSATSTTFGRRTSS